MKRCGNCIHYDVCDKYVEASESFPEMKGGCGAFKDKALFVKLPCKIGTPVFIINKKGKIFSGKFRLDDLDQFNKRVFLTRSEAEGVLKAE